MNKPTKIYSDYIEFGALEQFREAMSQDFAVQGALMPDAHQGYSLPIGGVVATKGVIVPAWVGYDIGCGMCAARIEIDVDNLEGHEQEIMDRIYDAVPVGQNKHKKAQNYNIVGLSVLGQTQAAKRGAVYQLGTLGGGNHFIEIGVDETDMSHVWVIVHSGSRGTGHGIAGEYMKIASGSTKAKEGHYALDENSAEGLAYINDMSWCLDYALASRRDMVTAAIKVISEVTGASTYTCDFINRNHNHAEKREGLWIHRKGATHAEKGMMGVIPGNMRDGSFIVKGKGNPDALFSSSHGAGRVLGRRKAKEQLNVQDFEDTMKGIYANVGQGTLDESPMAYKDIYKVMEDQKDLVEIIAHVKPLINLKG